MIEEDNTKEELTEQNDENIEVISIEEDAEILIDQVEGIYLNSFCFGYRPKSSYLASYNTV